MTGFLEDLARKRRQFLDGLDANHGDINLDIFEDFYPDKAHFVFELLQNAQDAGATKAHFKLSNHGCLFRHNGTRKFSETDVRSITGIHNSTKSKAPDKIGKFGVGFKSVFVYTLTPTVYSDRYSFQIERLVMPSIVTPMSGLGEDTCFWLPFNNPNKIPSEAYSEIRWGLEGLSDATLLFLSNLESVSWELEGNSTGDVLRIRHGEYHYEILKALSGKEPDSSHYLRFDKPVSGLTNQYVAMAFALDYVSGTTKYDGTKKLEDQLKIVPAAPGQVAVYFPAEKEMSGLRFHLHAPFVPELSRASIKESPANQPLFRLLATLSAESLHHIRDLGLLTVEFLGVLPNPEDPLPARYQNIRAAIIEEMNEESLTPTNSRSHRPARYLVRGKTVLKDLLTDEDLEYLVDYDEEAPVWCMAAPQKYSSDADRFLSGLEIREWDVEQFVQLLVNKASEGSRMLSAPPWVVNGPDKEFIGWISRKSAEWHQQLYALLYKEVTPEQSFRKLKDLKIVRLSDGGYSIGRTCYFPSEIEFDGDELPRVDQKVYSSGKSKAQQENARKFLENIGVKDVGEAEQVEAILKRRYVASNLRPKNSDFDRFVALLEKDSTKSDLFKNYLIFEGADGKWHNAAEIYLDSPFKETGLSNYYGALDGAAGRVALSDRYRNKSAAIQRISRFAEAVGAQTRLEIVEVYCHKNPQWQYLAAVGGERNTSPINRDYNAPELEKLLKNPTIRLSQFVWRTLCTLPRHPNYLRATYQRNNSAGARHADSQFVYLLRRTEWVPQGGNRFVRPSEALRDLLPDGFPYDPGWQWLKAIQFGEDVAKRTEEQKKKREAANELGFTDEESLERAKRFVALPKDEQEKVLEAFERSSTLELPDRELPNGVRRAQKVAAEAQDAPEKNSEQRTRAVSMYRDAVKKDTTPYLKQQYTNADGIMICQICKDELPFRLHDGSYYFEAVEILPELRKRHYQNYLALCPNHAAMYRYANESRDLIKEMLLELEGGELEVILAGKDETIYFTKSHKADIAAVIEADHELGKVEEGDAGVVGQ